MSYFDISLNCSPKCEEWENILDHYRDWVSDDDIWEIARESKDIPILGNIYQNLVLNRVLSHFCEETGESEDNLELFFYVNSIDTHLHINGKDIRTVDDYWDCVEKCRVH